jgi:hypothetical protein
MRQRAATSSDVRYSLAAAGPTLAHLQRTAQMSNSSRLAAGPAIFCRKLLQRRVVEHRFGEQLFFSLRFSSSGAFSSAGMRRPILLSVGAGNRIRTRDPLITNQVLYQLSYAGAPG